MADIPWSEIWPNLLRVRTLKFKTQSPEEAEKLFRKSQRGLFGEKKAVLTPEMWVVMDERKAEKSYRRSQVYTRKEGEKFPPMIHRIWQDLPRLQEFRVTWTGVWSDSETEEIIWKTQLETLKIEHLKTIQFPAPMEKEEQDKIQEEIFQSWEQKFRNCMEVYDQEHMSLASRDYRKMHWDAYQCRDFYLNWEKEWENSPQDEYEGKTPPVIRWLQHQGLLILTKVDLIQDWDRVDDYCEIAPIMGVGKVKKTWVAGNWVKDLHPLWDSFWERMGYLWNLKFTLCYSRKVKNPDWGEFHFRHRLRLYLEMEPREDDQLIGAGGTGYAWNTLPSYCT